MQNTTSGNDSHKTTPPLNLEQQIKTAWFGFWGLLLFFTFLIAWSASEADSFAIGLGKSAFLIALAVYFEGMIWGLYRNLLKTREIRRAYLGEEQVSLEMEGAAALAQTIRKLSLVSWMLLVVLQAGAALVTQKWMPVLFNSLFYGAFFVLPVLRSNRSLKSHDR